MGHTAAIATRLMAAGDYQGALTYIERGNHGAGEKVPAEFAVLLLKKSRCLEELGDRKRALEALDHPIVSAGRAVPGVREAIRERIAQLSRGDPTTAD